MPVTQHQLDILKQVASQSETLRHIADDMDDLKLLLSDHDKRIRFIERIIFTSIGALGLLKAVYDLYKTGSLL